MKLTVPSVGALKPAISESRVLLPQPEGPTMLTNSPSRTSIVTPSSATRRRFPVSKTLTTSTSRTSMGPSALIIVPAIAKFVLRGRARYNAGASRQYRRKPRSGRVGSQPRRFVSSVRQHRRLDMNGRLGGAVAGLVLALGLVGPASAQNWWP